MNAEAQRELAAGGDGAGEVAEDPRHLRLALQRALAVGGEPRARVIEVGLLADAGEDVGQRAPAGRAWSGWFVASSGRFARARQRDEALEIALLLAVEVALDLDEAVRSPEDPHQPVEGGARACRDRRRRRRRRAGRARRP